MHNLKWPLTFSFKISRHDWNMHPSVTKCCIVSSSFSDYGEALKGVFELSLGGEGKGREDLLFFFKSRMI